MSPLDDDEQEALRSDVPNSLISLRRLEKQMMKPGDGDLVQSPITFYLRASPSSRTTLGRTSSIFDISLNDPDSKAALEIVDQPYDPHCLYRELHDRAERLFGKGRRYRDEHEIKDR